MFTLVICFLIEATKMVRRVFPHFGMRKRLSIALETGPWWESPDMVFNAQYIWEDDLLPMLEYCKG